jgi:hypothetical protein
MLRFFSLKHFYWNNTHNTFVTLVLGFQVVGNLISLALLQYEKVGAHQHHLAQAFSWKFFSSWGAYLIFLHSTVIKPDPSYGWVFTCKNSLLWYVKFQGSYILEGLGDVDKDMFLV